MSEADGLSDEEYEVYILSQSCFCAAFNRDFNDVQAGSNDPTENHHSGSLLSKVTEGGVQYECSSARGKV